MKGVVQFEWMLLSTALVLYVVITGLTVQAKLTVRPPGNLLAFEVCATLHRDNVPSGFWVTYEEKSLMPALRAL